MYKTHTKEFTLLQFKSNKINFGMLLSIQLTEYKIITKYEKNVVH